MCGRLYSPGWYDFIDWSNFLTDAMRYHRSKYPHADRVIDRINTLREFMSESAIQHLGGLLQPHPRYFTNKGWDEWVESATILLRSVDYTIVAPVTLRQWLTQFEEGKYNERQLWEGLDSLVVMGDISSTEQREYFWKALSADKQSLLGNECAYFNPHHAVWSNKTETSARAGQALAQIMELHKLKDAAATARFLRMLVGIFMFVLDVVILVGLYKHATIGPNAYCVFVTLAMSVFPATLAVIVLFIYNIREHRTSQADLASTITRIDDLV